MKLADFMLGTLIVALIGILFLMIFIAAHPSIDPKKEVATISPEPIHDFQNGVWYFENHGTTESFGRNLSTFITFHPELEIVTVTGNGAGPYGTDIGFWVITKHR